MDRIVIWGINTALILLCLVLGVRVVGSVRDGLDQDPTHQDWSPPPPGDSTDLPKQSPSADVIIQRNLFNASTLLPKAQVNQEPEEDLPDTKLPLKLLGTVASSDPSISWAAVEDLDERKHLSVKIGDILKQEAKVERIERRRIVLSNRGKKEELTLDESQQVASRRPPARRPPTRSASRSTRSQNLSDRVKRLSENRFAISQDDVEKIRRSPSAFLTGGLLTPKYEEGQMVGMEVKSVKPGSWYEKLGIQDGEVIQAVNGVPIDSPQASAQALRELSKLSEAGSEVVASVVGVDGNQREITGEIGE